MGWFLVSNHYGWKRWFIKATVFVNLLKLVLCHSMWSILENTPCTPEKNMYFAFEGKWSESFQFSSVQSLSRVQLFVTPWLQHARPPCLTPTPRVHPNPCPLSQWCLPTIFSSVIPFFFCPKSFPASGSFPMSQLFASHGQILEFQLQHQTFQWTHRTDFL